MKKFLSLLILSSSVTITAIIAWRLSADALALIAGVLLGILAMSPALLMAMWLARGAVRDRERQTPSAYPPIIVTGGAPLGLPAQHASHPQQRQPSIDPSSSPPSVPPPRRWEMRVYGEE